jgi:AraC-like DNA-binding protein
MIHGSCSQTLVEDAREIPPEGSEAFPCEGYDERLGDRPGRVVPWHWHGEFEAIVVVEGTMSLSLPGRSLDVASGEAACVNLGVMHACAGAPECHIRDVVFSRSLVEGLPGSVFSSRYVGPVVGDPAFEAVVLRPGPEAASRGIADIAGAVDAMEREGPGFELEVRSLLSDLFLALALVRGPSGGQAVRASADEGRARAMCAFVAEHYAEAIQASDIAGAAGIGEREALRCFRRVLDVAPSSYLLRYRLERAAELLAADGRPSVSEVARRVGFSSPSNFSQQFRRLFGRSPREYRGEARGEA